MSTSILRKHLTLLVRGVLESEAHWANIWKAPPKIKLKDQKKGLYLFFGAPQSGASRPGAPLPWRPFALPSSAVNPFLWNSFLNLQCPDKNLVACYLKKLVLSEIPFQRTTSSFSGNISSLAPLQFYLIAIYTWYTLYQEWK